MNEGRTAEEKRELARSVTEAVATSVSVPPEDVFILIHDVPLANSAKAGVLRIDR